MAAGTDALFQFKDAMVFLAAAGVGVPLLQRLKVNPVLGFMLAGMAIGPYGFGQFAAQHDWVRYATITDPEEFEGLGEIGVIFLLFTIGLDLSPQRLWTMRRLVFGLGTAQVGVTAIALGLALGKLAGIFGAIWAAERLGFARRPEGASWLQVCGLALLCGIGFTMSLFIAQLAFPANPALVEQAKLGILVASLVTAALGYAVLRLAR